MFFPFGSKHSKGSKKNTKRAFARGYQPRVESLESRLNLAGNVVATFVGGNLTLTGDNLSNELRIEGSGVGEFSVEGVGTSLGGVLGGVQNFSGVRNITINFKNGDDVATFVTAELEGLLNYSGGNGNDQLDFGEFNDEDQSFGQLIANMGAGNDTIEVNGESDFTIAGFVYANGGDGNNTFDLDPADSLTLGSVSVVNGKGDDFVDLGDTVVNARSIVVNNGKGNNFFFLDGDTTIEGDLIVIGGNGNDDVNPGDTGGDFLNVGGAVVFNLGAGNNSTSLEQVETSIGAGLTILGGAGQDSVEFDGDVVNVGGSVTVVTGNGNDAVSLTAASGTNISGGLVVDTLGGADAVTLFDVTVNGATVVKTGEGNDAVIVDNSTFRGAVSLLTGGGNDTVSIEAGNQDDGVGTVFEQYAYVNLGAGNDTIDVGFDGDDFVTALQSVVIDGGKGTDTLADSGTNDYAFDPILVSIL